MRAYERIVNQILQKGRLKSNRTGVDTMAIAGAMFEHDMADGFPLLTTKRMPFKAIATELEFFIKGLRSKRWLQDRGCHIWNQWCNPQVVPYGHSDEERAAMAAEDDLGPIYGVQWRNFNGVDQLKNIVEGLQEDPSNRRLVVSAWNPKDLPSMALSPCHWGFQLTVIEDRVNMLWNQRSVDTALGLPFNIASYGLLLHLICKHVGMEEGKLIGFLGDVHIYWNHLEDLKAQVRREPMNLPSVETDLRYGLFDWETNETRIVGYQHHSPIKYEIAV